MSKRKLRGFNARLTMRFSGCALGEWLCRIACVALGANGFAVLPARGALWDVGTLIWEIAGLRLIYFYILLLTGLTHA